MYGKKMCGYVVSEGALSVSTKGLLDYYAPPTQKSVRYKHWIAILDPKTCPECRSRHGKIYEMEERADKNPPLHPNCRCTIKPMRAVKAGDGTKNGQDGADYWMKYYAKLGVLHYRGGTQTNGLEMGKVPIKICGGENAHNGAIPKQKPAFTPNTGKDLV